MANTPFERIWDQHVVKEYGEGRALIYIDRHFAQESTCERAFDGLRKAHLPVRRRDLTLGTIDHGVSTAPGRTAESFLPTRKRNVAMRDNCREFGVRMFDTDHPDHGIVHVTAPAIGFALPGCTYVCGDSHTASCGGVGALAWGIGTTEVLQVFAAQSLIQRKPRTMRINFHGQLGRGIYPKDIIMHLLGLHGVAFGVGHVVQYGGPVIDAMPIEGRITICNMSIEIGARAGFIAADETTFAYLKGREMSPKGARWDEAVAAWKAIFDDSNAVYDRVIDVDCTGIAPRVTWGISPGDMIGVDDLIPDPASAPDEGRRKTMEHTLNYVGLEAGAPIIGTPIDVAFIGSCTNGRLSDLRAAAEIVRGHKVAPGVRALVVPGAAHVKAAAEAEGLDKIFIDAGFEWREAGCSMCVGAGGDIVPPGKRSISTINRNFEGRQGPNSRTHMASPAMVAAAAVTGHITDVRKLMD
jgi:3-isopropylmalate/(R)-2-methylmalate dehydratase large subunit